MENLTYSCYLLLLALIPLVYFVRIGRPNSLRNSTDNPCLRLPPGPWELPVIGSVHHLFSALPHRTLRDLSRRHGPLMLLKLGKAPVIVVSGADAAKAVMKTHDNVFSTRPMSSALKVVLKYGNGISFSPYGEEWRQLCKACVVELLSAERIQSFWPVCERDHATHQVSPLIIIIIIIIIGAACESIRFGSRIHLTYLFPSSRLARALSSTLRRTKATRDTVFTYLDHVVSEHHDRRQSSSEKDDGHQDLIDVLLQIKADKGDNLQVPLTKDMIKIVTFELLTGGIEGPSTTMNWAMAELMRNPSAMSRAQAEVRRVFMGQNKVITQEGLAELPYLNCVIKETMRLHAPSPLLLPRQCQEQCKILGYDVPKGATVLVNAWAIARDPEYWPEPEAFMPERFQGSLIDPKGNNFEYTPFGSGRRMCPGMHFGLAQVQLVLASLLLYFDWALPDGILPGDLDMAETFGIVAKRKEDLLLRATPRVQLPC
ncbi:hypothetical protein BRADI_3g15020v3 [Brachypodium distachyon]|uniref:Cytochrome P450 n=1 Tax=Brachypodium distachyon TaxID=15368 RepID=A0A2K2CX63_BRADI|nr:hypothetical protein BRADI_3g15020v3 [Brachypodium distachyon]